MPNNCADIIFVISKCCSEKQLTGATAIVSTLLTVVGQPKRPISAGNGGFRRGLPCLPSMDSMSAVSSPQMYAPAPR